MSGSRYWRLCALALLGCAGNDVTTLGGGSAPPAESEAPASQTLQLLEEPDSVDVACRLVGVAAANLAAAGPDAASTCEAVVDDCRDTLAGLDAGDVELPDQDLSALLGCELTLAELDACVADVLANARDAYASSLSCGAAPAPALDALGLVASPKCFIVALRCPQILMSLGTLGPR